MGPTRQDKNIKALGKIPSSRNLNKSCKDKFNKQHDKLEKALKEVQCENLKTLPDKNILEKISILAKAVHLQRDNLKEVK